MAKLGYSVDSRTVAKYRPAGLSRGRGQRWTTFIRNHLQETWACDFFVVVTARFRVLYVFVVLSLGRRRIVHFGVTGHPTAAWTAQRLVEAVSDSESAGTPQANAFAERVIGTLRRDCLDHIIVWGERHAEQVLKEYVGYYHGRPHRGLHMQSPDGGQHLSPLRPCPGTPVVATPILAGLHHRYGFAARPPPAGRLAA